MKPTAGDVHVNAPLTNISVAYIQSAESYIADKVFPTVPVQKQSDRYFVYDKGDFFRDEVKERAPATESAGGGYALDNTPTYYARTYALHKDVDDQTRANSDSPLNPDRDASEYLTQQHLIRRDRVWASNYFVTTKWGLDLTGVAAAPGANQFLQFDQAAAKPAVTIRGEVVRIQEATGFKPNVLVLGARAYAAICDNPDILDRIKYTQRGIITPELLAPLFDVDRVVIARATYNTAKEGATTAMSYAVNSKAALLVYANPSPSIMMPSGGYTFTWAGLFGSGAGGARIKKFRMEQLAADRIEGEMAWDMKLVSSDVGTFFTAAVA
jgi:hypothetical protein